MHGTSPMAEHFASPPPKKMKYGIHPYYKTKVTIHTNGSTYLNTIPTISTEGLNSLLHQKIDICINNLEKDKQSNLCLIQNDALANGNALKNRQEKNHLEHYITQICTQYCLISLQEYKTSRKYNFQKNIKIFGKQNKKYLLQTYFLSDIAEQSTMDKIKLSDIIFFKSKKNRHLTNILDVDTFSHSFWNSGLNLNFTNTEDNVLFNFKKKYSFI